MCHLRVSTAFSPWHFLFLLAFPLLLKHALFVYRSKEPAVLRPMLAQMSMISLFINILFSLGLAYRLNRLILERKF